MAILFITFRYVAFALFIIFSSIICIISAVNLGALQPHTESFPQIDIFLIFTGAFALVLIFPVIFTELVRKNAFISRVIVEISWLTILWLMNIAGAAALIALSSEIRCFPTGDQSQTACSSALALLTFSWLNTISMLAYLLCLVVSSAYHAQDNNAVWNTGVRDYQWFVTQKKASPAPELRSAYGLLAAPSVPPVLPPVPPAPATTRRTRRRSMYAQQMGLTKDYRIEPLRVPNLPQIATPPNSDLPEPPPPVAAYLNKIQNSRFSSGNGEIPLPSPIMLHTQSVSSLYPQHLQGTTAPVNPPRPNGSDPSPPPAGDWPRKNPQEPLRPKHSRRRPRRDQSSSDDTTTAAADSSQRLNHQRLTGPRAPRPRPPRLNVLDI